MEKTKLGLSVAVASAATYLLVQFGGYTAALLLLGYIFLYEQNDKLKISVLTAVAVALAYSLGNVAINLLPNLLGILESFLSIFNVYVNLNVIHNIFSFFSSILSLTKTVVMILLSALALLDKPLELKFIKKLVND